MNPHSPKIRLDNARLAHSRALDNCPHWDHETNPDPHGAECCRAACKAYDEVRAARRALVTERVDK